MTKCILHVTDHEFDKILQLNHDSVVWKNTDREVREGIAVLIGKDVAEQVSKFDECRVEKHHELAGFPRVETL
jgi:hypothetical protein